MLEVIFEFIFSAVFEIIVQLFGELLAELGLSKWQDKKQHSKKSNPVLAFIGYLMLGALVGGVSLYLMPHQFISSESFAIANLIITPVVAGLVMSYVGYLRRKQGRDLVRLDSFSYGFGFAFAMAGVRFYFGV